jgi:DNA-binding beta-propeller fold protein YncE
MRTRSGGVSGRPTTKRAYVTNFWHGTVSVLDVEAGRILAQMATGAGAEGIGVSSISS